MIGVSHGRTSRSGSVVIMTLVRAQNALRPDIIATGYWINLTTSTTFNSAQQQSNNQGLLLWSRTYRGALPLSASLPSRKRVRCF